LLNKYYADLHIHIGAAENGERVKITASRKLTFPSILREARFKKGLNMVGIIDCASPVVLRDIKRMIDRKELVPLDGGGYLFDDELAVILGCELETKERKGRAHFLAYFPFFENMLSFSDVLNKHITNIRLSSQQTGLTASDIYSLTLERGGVLMPAHAFTPHRSIFGSCAHSLGEIFDDADSLSALELGLSANTELADKLYELGKLSFLSNSDAHSLPKIGREHNLLKFKEPSFEELVMALENKEGRRIEKNFGLDPRLGKYHRTCCLNCDRTSDISPPALDCFYCGSEDVVLGVLDRVVYLSQKQGEPESSIYSEESKNISTRPQYLHQLPLEFIPGIGPSTIERLINAFGSEMNVLHKVSETELADVIRPHLAELLIAGRSGKLKIIPGGGGKYGRVTDQII